MVRRVLLARGAALPESSGLGRAHHSIESLLQKALVPNWTKVGTIQHEEPKSSLDRILTRWWKQPRRVSEEIADSPADLLHITDQEQAHLVPKDSKVPVAVTVHDLFHLRPRSIIGGDAIVPVGDHSPGLVRKRDLSKLRSGLSRADLLICISESTRMDVMTSFPGKPTALVRHQVDVDYWSPAKNPKPRELLGDLDDESKMLVITVGSDEPRKRLNFAREVIGELPEEVSSDVNVLHIGSEVKVSDDQLVAAFQHAEVLLFPSACEGFGYPPAEAMAAGCPVMASDLTAHNEIIPDRCLLDPTSIADWVDELVRIHSEWRKSGGVPRHPDEELIDHVKSLLSPDSHGKSLADAYDLAVSPNQSV